MIHAKPLCRANPPRRTPNVVFWSDGHQGRRFPTIFALLGLVTASAPLLGNEAVINQARTTITTGELKSHIDVLSDDTFEGREAGSRGGRAAANYLMKYIKQGVYPAASDGRYSQMFGAGYRNLLGKIDGTDPKLKQECVLIGAHYDHVGYGTPRNSYGPFGMIHNGADDNASGVSALLEVIDAFAATELKCKRTIIFAFWDGEEKGLLGSEHWTTNPTVPLDRVKVAINIDMVGHLRNRRVEVLGSRTMTGFRTLIANANAGTDLRLDFLWEVKENSDHHSFFKRRIPVLMYHTGLHDDYHRPSDDAHLINAAGVRDVSKLIFNTLHVLANENSLSGFRSASRFEGKSDRYAYERPLPANRPRLGISWDAKNVGNGLRITKIRLGSAATAGGLKVGDSLLKLNGAIIDGTDSMHQRMVSAPTVSTFTVQRPDEEEPVEIKVRLTGKPTRLGIAWREHPAEPGSVNLVRVVPHSPAALAGLRVRDRVHEVNDQRFKNRREFLDMASNTPLPMNVLIERAGQFKSISIERPLTLNEVQ